jgi:protein SCO1
VGRAPRRLVSTSALCALLAALVYSACGKPAPLPVLADVPAFALRDQQAREVTREALLGKVWIANFIFTSCPDVCPLLTEQLASVRKGLLRADQAAGLAFVSFSVDPDHDTPERLAEFARQHGAVGADWWFLTGQVEDVKRVVKQGFKQAMEAQPLEPGKPRNVLHGTHFVLVDRRGKLRGFHASDEAGIHDLKAAATQLLAEP